MVDVRRGVDVATGVLEELRRTVVVSVGSGVMLPCPCGVLLGVPGVPVTAIVGVAVLAVEVGVAVPTDVGVSVGVPGVALPVGVSV